MIYQKIKEKDVEFLSKAGLLKNLKEEVEKQVTRFLKEELVNRLDDIYLFNKLEKNDYKIIGDKYLEELACDLNIEELIESMDDKIKGVRNVKKEICKRVNRKNEDRTILKLDSSIGLSFVVFKTRFLCLIRSIYKNEFI